jgi:hypothetical protein
LFFPDEKIPKVVGNVVKKNKFDPLETGWKEEMFFVSTVKELLWDGMPGKRKLFFLAKMQYFSK